MNFYWRCLVLPYKKTRSAGEASELVLPVDTEWWLVLQSSPQRREVFLEGVFSVLKPRVAVVIVLQGRRGRHPRKQREPPRLKQLRRPRPSSTWRIWPFLAFSFFFLVKCYHVLGLLAFRASRGWPCLCGGRRPSAPLTKLCSKLVFFPLLC